MSYAKITAETIQLDNGTTNTTITSSSLSSNGPFSITNVNMSGVTSVTPDVTDNSSKLATTSFVSQKIANMSLSGYETTSNKSINVSTNASSDTMYPSVKAVKTYVDAALSAYTPTNTSMSLYAQMAATQTWSAVQTFGSGVLASSYNALTATSNISLGTNLTTGILSLGTSTATINLNGPFTPTYTAKPTANQIGYNIYLDYQISSTYAFSGGERVFRFSEATPGATYFVSASAAPSINVDYFLICICLLRTTPSIGLDVSTYGSAITDNRFIDQSTVCASANTTNRILAAEFYACSTVIYVPAGFTTIALCSNTYKPGNPTGSLISSMSITRIG